MRHIAEEYILPVLTGFGLLGNLLLLGTVYGKQSFWRHLKPIVIYLAICDLVLLTHGFFFFYRDSTKSPLFYDEWMRAYAYNYTILGVAFSAHIWATVALTFERYTAVAHPIWHKTKRPQFLVAIQLIVLTLISTGANMPRFFEFSLQNTTLSNNTVGLRLITSSFSKTTEYWAYRVVSRLIFTSLVPTIILSYLTGRIIHIVHYSQSKASQQNGVFIALPLGDYDIISPKAQKKLTQSQRRSTMGSELERPQSNRLLVTDAQKRNRLYSFDQKKTKSNPNFADEMNSKESVSSVRQSKTYKSCVSVPTAALANVEASTSSQLDCPSSDDPQARKRSTRCWGSVMLHSRSGINRALIVIPTIAIICYIPPTILDVVKLISPQLLNRSSSSPALLYFASASNLCALFDAVCNFYVYFLCSERFRAHFCHYLKHFWNCCRRKN